MAQNTFPFRLLKECGHLLPRTPPTVYWEVGLQSILVEIRTCTLSCLHLFESHKRHVNARWEQDLCYLWTKHRLAFFLHFLSSCIDKLGILCKQKWGIDPLIKKVNEHISGDSNFGSQPQNVRLLLQNELMWPSGLLTMWGRLLSLKEQGHTLPEAMVPDTVDYDITATVSCKNPKGKKGEVTPGVSHYVSKHKHRDGREGCCEGKC